MPRSPRLRTDYLVSAVVLLALIVAGLLLARLVEPDRRPPPVPAPRAGGYLFCHWNVENLFDDRDDPRDHDALENWFGRDPAAVRAKLDRLADALLRLNGGRGPDILALVEVENRRAVDLLRRALNDRLSAEWQYPEAGLVHRDNRSGRRIEPAILTRLRAQEVPPSDRDRGRRILTARVEAGGATLIVQASHWTSRVTDRTGQKRSAYAEVLYADFLDFHADDPAVDLLMAGDFNDEPADESVRVHLRATGDRALIRPGDPRPFLLNLMAGLDPRRDGTYLFRNRWQILDHLVASPGLLDARGWAVVPGTLAVVHDEDLRHGKARGPLRFGVEDNANPRGPSDHFAVTVRLSAEGGAEGVR